ncbi:MAG: DUF4097 family beta strand repeat protein [Clostridia bacterium]|nr:DUF4097 family beta strand repeat protein [Clostridia bacterium]MBQ6961192.1 DUF4097 family beta strand repeat protein [Clostridia bacterium]MBR0219810.1 DUF4097 family beta strand repeat protein [Clostridia bacterium]
MKSNKLLKILAALCAVVLLAAAWMMPLAQAEQDHVGDGETGAAIREMKINWTSGRVHIAYHSGNTIRISEKITGTISDDMRMRWRVEGDTLTIEYDQPGFHLFSLTSYEKELTVTLPEHFVFEKANISATSADLDIPALYADSVQLKSTSGDIRAKVTARTIQGEMTSGDMELQVMSAAEEIKLNSTSGNIILESGWDAGKTKIETTSGTIQAAVKQTKEFKAASTSGNIHAVLGETKEVTFKSTSGNIIAEITGMEELEIRATSGDVTAYLPTVPGFTARVETTSGDFQHTLSLNKEGKTYRCGDGSAKVEIHTTSGSIKISEKAR